MGTPTLKRVNGAIILENGLVPPCSILLIISFPCENEAIKHDLVEFKVQCLKVFSYHGNKSTILLFYSIFGTTPEVSSKLYFVEICEVSEKLWLFNHKRADFGFQILDLKDHFSASLIIATLTPLCQTVSSAYHLQN